MLPDLALALRLQALDRKIAQVENEIATLPKHIAEIQKKLTVQTRRLESDKAALSANQLERKKFEGDIQSNDARISKLKGQMLEAKTNEQYRAFQNEIEFIEKATRTAEDHILDLMEKSESLDGTVRAADGELKKQQAAVDAETKEARSRTAADQAQLASVQGERKTIVAEMNPQVYAQYERIRKKSKGIVVADASDGRCGACHITLRPQFFQDLRRGDQIMYCEMCGRMLTYNPVVDMSNNVAPASHQPA